MKAMKVIAMIIGSATTSHFHFRRRDTGAAVSAGSAGTLYVVTDRRGAGTCESRYPDQG
jgi:hypothetical protein